MADFFIKRDDTRPIIEATLKDEDGNAVDLTGATVRFHMTERAKFGALKVDAGATLQDAANGVVRYTWQAADTDTEGDFDVEWEVTYSGGGIETFPSDSFNVVRVTKDLG